jgi:hypothetical protein
VAAGVAGGAAEPGGGEVRGGSRQASTECRLLRALLAQRRRPGCVAVLKHATLAGGDLCKALLGPVLGQRTRVGGGKGLRRVPQATRSPRAPRAAASRLRAEVARLQGARRPRRWKWRPRRGKEVGGRAAGSTRTRRNTARTQSWGRVSDLSREHIRP